MRELLRTYVIALVGYSTVGSTGPVSLEGLQSRKENSAPTIFAFDQGEPDEVRARWRGLGVKALAWQRHSSDTRHPHLWNTLEAWAQWADDPDAGRRSIVALAQQRPPELEPFQRGQVAALVRTTRRALRFSRRRHRRLLPSGSARLIGRFATSSLDATTATTLTGSNTMDWTTTLRGPRRPGMMDGTTQLSATTCFRSAIRTSARITTSDLPEPGRERPIRFLRGCCIWRSGLHVPFIRWRPGGRLAMQSCTVTY